MIMRYETLHKYPPIFQKCTGLSVAEFDGLVADLLPQYVEAEIERLSQRERQRDIGGGAQYKLELQDHLLLVIVWLRLYPTGVVLGYLFGVSEPTASRTKKRVLPLLEQAGRDTMRLPQPGQRTRRDLSVLLAMLPELSVIVDSFEQPVQRPQDPSEQKRYYSGKKKRHTLKSQIAVDAQTGYIVEVSDSVPGPTADITLLRDSGLLERLPEEMGIGGDLAYLALPGLRANGFAPRRKPRGKPRPDQDIIYNRVFAHFRIIVEQVIGRLRRFQSLSQPDRHHRLDHSARTTAVAGLVNRHFMAGGIV